MPVYHQLSMLQQKYKFIIDDMCLVIHDICNFVQTGHVYAAQDLLMSIAPPNNLNIDI
jgi:hypothetical protein